MILQNLWRFAIFTIYVNLACSQNIKLPDSFNNKLGVPCSEAPCDTRNAAVGEACDGGDIFCVQQWSFCDLTSMNCVCQYGLTPESPSKCRRPGELGDDCGPDNFCMVENSECDHNGMCSCKYGFVQDGNECKKPPSLGEPCTVDDDCVADHSVCQLGICICRDDYYESNDGTSCYPKKDLGEVCQKYEECKDPEAICRDFGDGNSGICDCNDYYYAEANQCVPKKKFGEQCEDVRECQDPGGECRDDGSGVKVCLCRFEYYYDVTNGMCLPKKDLMEPCNEDHECLSEFSICYDIFGGSDKVCTCSDISTEYQNWCFLKKEHIGDYCAVPPQCVYDHGICVEDKCACETGYSAQNDACVPNPVLGGNCTSDNQCTVFGSECSSKGVCDCKSGFVANAGMQTCHQIRYVVNDPCDIDEQCTAGSLGEHSLCKNDTSDGVQSCQCRDLAVYDPAATRQVCYPKQLELDAPCVINQQCYANLGRYAHCDGNSKTCTCVAHAVSDPENTYCYPIVDYAGSPCEIKRQCINGNLGSLSDCLENDNGNKFCECKFNAVNDPNITPSRCFEKRHYLNETCDIDQQCSVNIGPLSYCSQDRICECQRNTGRPNQDGTKCIPT